MALAIRNLEYVDFYERSLASPGPARSRSTAATASTPRSATRAFARSSSRGPEPGDRGHVVVRCRLGPRPATWTGPFRVGKSNSFALASGRRGLWLAHEISAGYPDRMVVRKFSGNRFGRATGSGRPPRADAVGRRARQDAAGRMVAVWYSSTGERLEYSKSRTGRRWSRARVLTTGVETPADLQVALGPDGRGLAV